jgi:hypothetical protein
VASSGSDRDRGFFVSGLSQCDARDTPIYPFPLLNEFVDPSDKQANTIMPNTPFAVLVSGIATEQVLQALRDFIANVGVLHIDAYVNLIAEFFA